MQFPSPLHEVSQPFKDFITSTTSTDSNNTNDDLDRKFKCLNISILLFKIYIATNILDLPSETRYLSFVTFYRYLYHYQIQYDNIHRDISINKNDSGDGDEVMSKPKDHLGKIAAATLFLACKITNENRRIRDVINVHHMLQFDSDSDSDSDHHDEIDISSNSNNTKNDHVQKKNVIIQCCSTPPTLDEEYWHFKEEIVKIEHHLLRVLNFDVFQVTVTPYRIVVSLVEEIIALLKAGEEEEEEEVGESDATSNSTFGNDNRILFHQTFQNIIHSSWRRINDALFDVDTMTLKTSELACGALQLAFEEEENMNTNGTSTSTSTMVRHGLLERIQGYGYWEWVDVNLESMNGAKSKLIVAGDRLTNFWTA